MWTIWVGAHRYVFYAIVTLTLWVVATYWFFKVDLRRIVQNNRPRTWSADMQTKTGKGGINKSQH